MYHNRASYQKINHNMPTHKTPTAKKPVLRYKDANGAIFHELTVGRLQQIAKHNPAYDKTSILLALLNGQEFSILSMSVSIAYK